MKQLTILQLIRLLRKTDEVYVEALYTAGGCYRFHVFLSELYPGCEPRINKEENHITTLYKGKQYDINGVVKHPEKFFKPNKRQLKLAKTWSFYKHNYMKCGECHVCEEEYIV